MAASTVISNNRSWDLNESEVGYNLETNATIIGNTEDSIWKVYIPKILPLIPMNIPTESIESLSASSIFINAAMCKPVVQKIIKSRNFIKVKHQANCSFNYKHKKYGTKVDIEVLNKNVDNLRITNTVDESFAIQSD